MPYSDPAMRSTPKEQGNNSNMIGRLLFKTAASNNTKSKEYS